MQGVAVPARTSGAMNVAQSPLFEGTLAEDAAGLREYFQLRVSHHDEPKRTDCLQPGCSRPMTRICHEGSERLDIAKVSRQRSGWPMQNFGISCLTRSGGTPSVHSIVAVSCRTR